MTLIGAQRKTGRPLDDRRETLARCRREMRTPMNVDEGREDVKHNSGCSLVRLRMIQAAVMVLYCGAELHPCIEPSPNGILDARTLRIRPVQTHRLLEPRAAEARGRRPPPSR